MTRMTKRIAVVLALCLAAAACGGGGDAGKAKGGKDVVVGAIFDLSGATADVGTPYSEGIRDYVEWRNKNGGASGRQIKLVWQDYQYNVATAEQLYSQFISQGAVAFMGWGTGDTEALRTRVTSDQIPFMSASYAETLTDPKDTPFNFVPGTSYSDQMRLLLKWIAGQASGRADIAVFHHDSPFGKAPLKDGADYVKSKGLNLGFKTYAMPAGATDYVGELSQAKRQGADYIVLQQVSSPAAKLAKNVAQQKLGTKIVCLNWCADELFIKLAGPAAEGVIGVLPFSPPTITATGLEQPKKYLESKGGNLNSKGLHYVQGWYTMAAMADAIADAAKSGKDVTGPAIRSALEKVALDTGGVSQPVRFSTDSHKGMLGARLFKVQGGKWVPLTDELTP